MLPGAVVSGLSQGGSYFYAHAIVGGIQFFVAEDMTTSKLCWLLEGDHPHFIETAINSLPGGLPTMASSFIKTSQGRIFQKIHIAILCNIITKLTSHHLWCILLPKSKPHVLSTLTGMGLHKSMNTRKWGSWGYFRVFTPQKLWVTTLARGDNHLSLDSRLKP